MGVSVGASVGASVGVSVCLSADVSVDVPVVVSGRVREQVRGRRRLFDSFFLIHTSRALTGFPLAAPSLGRSGIPSLVVAITLDCCSTVITGEIGVD